MGRVVIISAVLWGLFFSGCGVYTFNPRGKSEIKSIAVERFGNQTAEYGLEDQVTDLVTDALISDGTIQVVSSDLAEALLEGTLVGYDRKPYNYDENDQVTSYEVTMAFQITLRNRADDTELWTERISQRGTYLVDTETEDAAQQTAIKLLVDDILNKTTKSW